MSDLIDVRSRVSEQAHMALIAEERATGRSMCEQIRELIEAWAGQRVHAAQVLHRLMRGNEHAAEPPGDTGK